MKTIYLIRHGESEYNKQKRMAGWTDCMLTELGINQASTAAVRMSEFEGIEGVFTSDLMRAKKTAHIIAEKIAVEVHATQALRETFLGAWEGLTAEQIEDRDPELLKEWFADYTTFKYPGGESIDEMLARSDSFIQSILEDYNNIVVVAHSGVISSLMSYLLFGDITKSAIFRVKNARIQRLICDGNQWMIDLLNG